MAIKVRDWLDKIEYKVPKIDAQLPALIAKNSPLSATYFSS